MTGVVEQGGLSHTASAIVAVDARRAFAFLADGISLGCWALGSFDTVALAGGLFVGHSLFDGKALYIRINPDARKLVVIYEVGSRPDELSPRITAKVEPLEGVHSAAPRCRVSLTAGRAPEMTEERWRQLAIIHETEILLIKGQLEQPTRRAR